MVPTMLPFKNKTNKHRMIASCASMLMRGISSDVSRNSICPCSVPFSSQRHTQDEFNHDSVPKNSAA
ncbi:hypothetical protein FJTKL_02649 [Diaporthe vaccinii]|uniref:Uncharacterized protein n=1 Tax=Diaporthe vaccinii TaxID=105482 RepID=A0ABR4DXK8_9PEZI